MENKSTPAAQKKSPTGGDQADGDRQPKSEPVIDQVMADALRKALQSSGRCACRAVSEELTQYDRGEYSRRHEARKELIEMTNLNALSSREQFLIDAAVTRAKKEIFTTLIESRVI